MTDDPMQNPAAHTVEPDRFRFVLGHLATGVAVVTAYGAPEPWALAVNSMTSVSLMPPLVLFCPARTSTSWPHLKEIGSYCINVMGAAHEATVRGLAAKRADRFATVTFQDRHSGPAFADAIAWLDCETWAEHDAGDHTIVVAKVNAIAVADSVELEPLIFFRGRYGTFEPR